MATRCTGRNQTARLKTRVLRRACTDPEKYYGFSSAFVHVDDDKLLDLIVINDSTPNQLYHQQGQRNV